LSCNAELSGHRYVQIATTVANEENKSRFQDLFQLVRRHDWKLLSKYKDFRADQNDVLVYAITGPHRDGMVAVIFTPFELYAPSELYLQEKLPAEELADIAELTSNSWQQF